MNYLDYRNAFLAHHGILGQKWGVRNGPPYPLDADDHSTREKKAGWKKSLDRTEKKKKLKKIAKVAGIALGAAVVAGTAYYAYGHVGKYYVDWAIEAGKTMQTLSSDPDRISKGNQFYTAYRNSDKAKYLADFSQEYDSVNSTGSNIAFKNKYKIEMLAKSNLKIASYNTSKQVFDDLMANDPEFSKAFNKFYSDRSLGLAFGRNKLLRTDYSKFNIHVPMSQITGSNPDEYQSAVGRAASIMTEKFNDALKEKGYAGYADVADLRGWNTNAVILFDRSNIEVINTAKLSDEEIRKNIKAAKMLDIWDKVWGLAV